MRRGSRRSACCRRLRADRLLGLADGGRCPATRSPAFAETARNLVWVGLLYSLSAASEERQHGVRLVYGAVAGVIGLQLIGDTLSACSARATRSPQTGLILRITDRRRRAGPGPQSLRPGRAGEPVAHPARDARAGADVGLRPQSLHHRLSRPAQRGAACSTGAALALALTAPLFALGGAQRRAAGGSGCRARRPSSRSRCSRSAPISR